MRVFHVRPTVVRGVVCAAFLCAMAGALAPAGLAGQARTVGEGVYSAAQADRGQQTYQAECMSCHGKALEGSVGPPLAGGGFLSVWGGRPLTELVDKIEKTMPPSQPGSVSHQQAIELTAHVLRFGKFPAGQNDLATSALAQISFPRAQAAAGASAGAPSLAAASNLAQLMRAVTFPNANILFNVQVKDPAKEKPAMPVPFDYVAWGATVYYGWQAVDQAALALIETTPLFLVPGRRCENGRPVPVDRADWKKYTDALVEVGRTAYKAAQSRDMEAVNKVADQLNDSCANCHKVYRDGAKEGDTAGATRCQ